MDMQALRRLTLRVPKPCLENRLYQLRDRLIRQQAFVQADDRADRLEQEVQHFPLGLVKKR